MIGKNDVPSTIVNFDSSGNQVQKFDVNGNAVDAHDGGLKEFNGVYYLYGTSYDCGYELSVRGSQFCGFKSYSSTDLVNWTDDGFMFDANGYPDVWQVRCVQGRYGCYRPHVLYNPSTGLYVLWVNTYDNPTGYRVFTSGNPTSGFVEVGPVTAPVAAFGSLPGTGYVNGDFDLFLDDDGIAYIAYTARLQAQAGYPTHTIDVMALNSAFTSAVGPVTVADSAGNVESPSLTKRNGSYYLVYGPACAYCSGRETDYQATTDIRRWDGVRHRLNGNSCGGQPSFVTRIGDQYLYGSDLWQPYAAAGAVNANQALAQYFWTPLTFSGSAILPFQCAQQVTVNTHTAGTTDPTTYRNICDITVSTGRGQVFTAATTGTLSSVSINTFGSKANGDVSVQLYAATNGLPSGSPLGSSQAVHWGWSSRAWVLAADQPVIQGQQYALVLSTSNNTSGCYGWDVAENNPYPGGTEISNVQGGWTVEPARDLRFSVTIT